MTNPNWQEISRYITPFFFLGILVLGGFLVDDYGMSWDEAAQRKHGFIALDYATEFLGIQWEKVHPEDNLSEYGGRHYTLLYSMFCGIAEKTLGVENSFRSRYLLRHTIVFLLFWTSLLFFYRTVLLRFKDFRMALLGVALLLLSPRIFANAFYNPKDMILFSFYLIGSYTCLLFFLRNNLWVAVLHGAITGLAINTRFTALYIPAFTLLLILMDLIQSRFAKSLLKRYLLHYPVYLSVCLLVTVVCFPYLWQDTFPRLWEAYRVMANFPWGSHNLYFGTFISGDEMPWHYIPVWIGITTPILYLILFAVGLFLILIKLQKNLVSFKFWKTDQQFVDIAAIGLFLGPLAVVILLNSTLYNGWRHLYFIYPSILLIALTGLDALLRNSSKTVAIITRWTLALSMATTTFFMIRNHPLQQVYFNTLAGEGLTERFDMDYWGLAYKQAFEELSARVGKDKVRVRCANYPCEDNYRFLPSDYQDRLELVWETDKADFYLSNFRRPEEHEKFMQRIYPYAREFFSIKVNGNPVIGVYQLR